MIIHFISTSANFCYLHMISVITGLKHDCDGVFFWAMEEPTGPYWDRISEFVILKFFDDPKLPALQNKSEPFRLAHLKDFMQWKILQEYGGAVLDMDTISIKDISHWYKDHEGVVASLDVKTPDDTAFPFNNAVVLAHKESEMIKRMNRFSDALFHMSDMVWGMSGPILLSIVGLSRYANFMAPKHEVFNPFGGNEIAQVYQENSDLKLPDETEIIHLYAKASPMFEKVNADFVRTSKSLLARLIRDILPESDWDVKLPWDIEGYLKQRGQHYRRLFQIARNSNVRNIMEIGTSSGQTAIGMITVADEQRVGPIINYHGIDLFETGTPALWEKEFTGGFVPPKRMDVEEILIQQTFANIDLIAANSTELTVEALCNEYGWPKMDLIFIDGGHAIETVRKDWELAKGMSHANTVIVFDDYFPEMPFIGAKVVVDAIDRERYDVQLSEEVDDYSHPFGRLRTQLAIVQAGKKKEVAVPINRIEAGQPSKPWAKDIMSRIRQSNMSPDVEIYSKEYFDKINQEEFHQAQRLADILFGKYQPAYVVDWGCATGLYLHPFTMKGCKVLGIEKSPIAILQSPADVRIVHMDMTQPMVNLQTLKKYDLAICLEVLEHIEEEYADVAVGNIARSSDRLILSIAGPNQPGPGHVNLQNKEYWLDKFGLHGFELNTQTTAEIVNEMKKGYHMGWLVNNLMVLEKT